MAARQTQREGKILLVDDDPGLLRLLSIRLRAEGYEVEAVDSAHKALATLGPFSPDLVITDLRMDKMDGIGLLKELQRRAPGLRVLIITAHGTIPDAVTATQSGGRGGDGYGGADAGSGPSCCTSTCTCSCSCPCPGPCPGPGAPRRASAAASSFICSVV